MSLYDWDLDKIKTTIDDDKKYESLANELYNKKDKATEELFNRQDSFLQFKKLYRNSFKNLCRVDEDMTEYLFNIHDKALLSDLPTVILPHHEISDEELIEYIIELFNYLDDKELTKAINTIINPDNHYLRIKGIEESSLSSLIKGRVLKSNSSNESFCSYYKKGTDEDLVLLSHELGHALSHNLFYGNINMYMNYFLTEVESYYIELLMGYYLGKKYDMTKLALIFRSNRLSKIMDQSWNIYIHSLLDDYFLNPDLDKISKQLKEEGYPYYLNKENYKSILKISTLYRGKMVNSYLVALELFFKTVFDKEKGIDTYKKLFTSDIDDYKKLLKEFDIDYINDNSKVDGMIEESKALKKILMNEGK